jgi:hypothetical protein
MAQKTYDINNGPSKFDMMVSLFDDDVPCRSTVLFHLENEPMREFIIDICERQDAASFHWLLRGYVVVRLSNGQLRLREKFEDSYNLHYRKGQMNIINDD